MIMGNPLYLTNQTLERKRPPRANGAKEAKKLANMNGHVRVDSLSYDRAMNILQIVKPLSDVSLISQSSIGCHYPQASD